MVRTRQDWGVAGGLWAVRACGNPGSGLLTKGVEELFLRSEGSGGRLGERCTQLGCGVGGVWGSQSGCTERVCVCRVHVRKGWDQILGHSGPILVALFSKWWRAQGSCMRRGQFSSTRWVCGYWSILGWIERRSGRQKSSLGGSHSLFRWEVAGIWNWPRRDGQLGTTVEVKSLRNGPGGTQTVVLVLGGKWGRGIWF